MNGEKMSEEMIIHECECPKCQSGEVHPEREHHEQINLLMSRMDEQQKRWYAAVEANRHGHGGEKLAAQITGLVRKTIRRGRKELAERLANNTPGRVREPGGGRKPVEKKDRKSKGSYTS